MDRADADRGSRDDVTDAKRVEAEHERLLARQQFLDEARRVLAASLDYEATLQTVARLSVPMLGDLVIVDVIGEEGGFKASPWRSPTPSRESWCGRRLSADLALKDHPVNRAIRTRRSQILSGEEAMHAAAFSAEQLDVMRRLDHARSGRPADRAGAHWSSCSSRSLVNRRASTVLRTSR